MTIAGGEIRHSCYRTVSITVHTDACVKRFIQPHSSQAGGMLTNASSSITTSQHASNVNRTLYGRNISPRHCKNKTDKALQFIIQREEAISRHPKHDWLDFSWSYERSSNCKNMTTYIYTPQKLTHYFILPLPMLISAAKHRQQ